MIILKDNIKYKYASKDKEEKYLNRFEPLLESKDFDESDKISSKEVLWRINNLKKYEKTKNWKLNNDSNKKMKVKK